MKINRYGLGAIVGAGALLVGGGTALARGGDHGGPRCEALLAKVAEKRGVSVEQLTADIEARMLARIDAAEKAGRLSPERAARLRERVSEGNLCRAVAKHRRAHVVPRGMLCSAADFLGLDRAELRAQLPGTSLASLAQKQGKSVEALTAAMVAPAEQRLANLVASRRITQARADAALARLQALAQRLASRVFPAR
jgi:hypothetical protein